MGAPLNDSGFHRTLVSVEPNGPIVKWSGFFEIDGFINKELGINKVIINYDGNDEEMILGSDGSFNAGLQIENTLDVRITTYKGKKQIGKVLTFKIEVE